MPFAILPRGVLDLPTEYLPTVALVIFELYQPAGAAASRETALWRSFRINLSNR